jgi:protein SCO1
MPKFLAVLSLVAIVIAAVVLVRQDPSSSPLVLDSGHVVVPPRTLDSFELIDHRDRTFDNDQLMGRWSIAMIGFTHCPDICPTALHQLAILRERLAERDGELGVVFVSVDPERDTPDVLDRYIGFFGTGLIGATGEGQQLRRFADSLDFAWVKVPQGQGRYTVDHSGALALIDPEARLAGYFVPPFDLEAMEADLERVLGLARIR